MSTAILAPWAKDEVTRLGAKTYKKEILKFGHVVTDDGEFDFTPEFGSQMIEAFQAGVMSSVPLQLADKDNSHTQAVDRMGGEIVGLELSNDGLYGIISADDKTADLINRNPRVGVSIRALQGRKDNSGKVWPAVLNHVLMTTDPVVTGMKNWEPIELSNDVTDVIDLANPVGHNKEDQMPKMIGKLSTEEAERLHELLGKMLGADGENQDPEDNPDGGEVEDPEKGGDAPGTVEDPSGTGTGDESETEDGIDLSKLSDEELEALLLSEDDDDDDVTEETPDNVTPMNPQPAKGKIDVGADGVVEAEPIAASNADAPAVELANAQHSEMAIELSRMRAELDAKNYEAERAELVRETGLPPRIIDLARPVLTGSGHVIELSNTSGEKEKVDAGKVVRELLTAIGKTTKALDLSHPVGFALEADEDESQEKTEREQFIAQAKEQFRLG